MIDEDLNGLISIVSTGGDALYSSFFGEIIGSGVRFHKSQIEQSASLEKAPVRSVLEIFEKIS